MAFFLLLLVLGILFFLIIPLICFHIAFYVPRPKNGIRQTTPLPQGEVYEPYRELLEGWTQEVKTMPHEEFRITSFDGLNLYANYYEYAPGAPIELMFHGYRGSAQRDLSGGVKRCFALGRSAFIVDQRGSGRSDGTVISFGINEHRDCLRWVDFMLEHFGPDVKIILTGISMGASTVLIAAGQPLPPNVIGVLADCGFSSARSIIKNTIRGMNLPADLLYPFVRLGARLYGHFDLEETSSVEAVKSCQVPAIFFHGEADDFVPCSMSRENYEACVSRKQLVLIPGAGHGLSFPADQEVYLKALGDFFGPEASAQ
ncbi:MAG: alpha/beta fold hydrolase [Oscillospiraceae bacterium]|nr:alpha/beta fold hydrolase [Oscillospiraceae bacterium]